ncbi:MAG: C69 family dipeptidase, partial [Coriobacteriales bacterium]|nr:C69 family dipeptidase [Coriobacteriales bacterium]
MRKKLFRMATIFAVVLTLVFGNTIQAIACTQIYLGSETTDDGSILWGRSEDISQSYGKVYTVHPAEDHASGDQFVSSQGFKMPYPEHTFRYTLVKDQYSNDRITPEPYGEAGINENGVAVSSSVTLSGGKTEIVGPRNAPGGVDPRVSTNNGGIEEAEVTSVVLMQATSARHGVEVLANIYDTYGTATLDGTQIGDANEVWFMHALSGHQYVAVRMPADKIGFSPNMTLLGEVDVTDTDNVIASPGLIAKAVAAGTFVAGPNDDPSSPDAIDGHTTINVTRSYASDPSVSGRLYLGYYYLKGVDAAKALNADELDYFIEPRADGKYDLYEAMRFLAYHGNAADAEDGR